MDSLMTHIQMEKTYYAQAFNKSSQKSTSPAKTSSRKQSDVSENLSSKTLISLEDDESFEIDVEMDFKSDLNQEIDSIFC